MICVRCAPSYAPERKYILDVILREFLGLAYRVEVEDRPDWRLSLDETPELGALYLPDVLFKTPQAAWLTPDALPLEPLARLPWNGSSPPDDIEDEEDLPVLYGVTGARQLAVVDGNEARLAVDIFGSAFYMLTRYEELVDEGRHPYDRFPASASIATRANFLHRPIVNEYLEMLWGVMQQLWPGLMRKAREYRLLHSCDVDLPFATAGRSFARVMKSAASDALRRRNPQLALQRISAISATRAGKLDADPYWTFDFMMEGAEAHGQLVTFYFLTDPTEYSLEDPRIINLLKQIRQRGHAIGVHPALDTFQKPLAVQQARQAVERAMQLAGVSQDAIGGRQHFLQWACPDTWQAYADAKFSHDSSLGFADEAGFRCGICYEYPVFNLQTRQALPLIERPLIVMEVSLFNYEKLGNEAALNRINRLKAQCRKHRGDFTLLWHNSELYDPQRKVMFQQAIWP